AETKNLSGHRLELSHIWHADSDEAKQTANTLQVFLPRRELVLEQKEHLSPLQTSPYGPPGNQQPSIDGIRTFLSKARSAAALTVAGHQPLLGWIADAFAGEAHPIQHAELLCLHFDRGIRPRRWWQSRRLAVGRRAVLRWVLTPGDPSSVINELKDKIRGKM